MSTDIREELGNFGCYLGQALRLMAGVSDYDTYVWHMQKTHPGQIVMTYEGFFRERQDTYCAGCIGRCC